MICFLKIKNLINLVTRNYLLVTINNYIFILFTFNLSILIVPNL